MFTQCTSLFATPGSLQRLYIRARQLPTQGRGTTAINAAPVFEIADAAATLRIAISLTASTGIVTALLTSTAPLLAQSSSKSEREVSSEADDAQGVKWGLMSVVSCLPLFNWLAWIFAAFENEDRSKFYYALAVLYAVPQLNVGFQQDWLSLSTLVLGIAHVQAERLAEERGVAQDLQPKIWDKSAPGQAAKLLSDSTQAFAEALKGMQSNSPEADDTDAGSSSREELQRWDKLFDSRRPSSEQERRK